MIRAICFCSGRVTDTGAVDEPTRLPRVEALQGIDVKPNECVRALVGNLLDLDSTLRREHEQRLLDATVEREREVVLLRDVGRLLDPEPLHDVALDVETDDVLRVLLGLVRARRELDATCLAAATGQHLRLDDDRAAEHLGRLTGLARRGREPPRRRPGSRRAGTAPCPDTRRDPSAHEPTCSVVRRILSMRRPLLVGLLAAAVAAAVAGCGSTRASLCRQPSRRRRRRRSSAWNESVSRREARARLRRLVVHGHADGLDGRDLGREQLDGRLGGRRARLRCASSRLRRPALPDRTISTSSSAATARATCPRSGRARASGRHFPPCSKPGADVGGNDLRARARSPAASGSGSRSARSGASATPPEGAQPQVVWFTDHAHELETVAAEPA